MSRILDRVALIACAVYLIGALSYLPLIAIGADAKVAARLPFELYLLLPAALIGAFVCAVFLRSQHKPIVAGKLAIAAVGTAAIIRLLYQIVPGVFFVSADALGVVMNYAIVCLIAYCVALFVVGFLLVARVVRRS